MIQRDRQRLSFAPRYEMYSEARSTKLHPISRVHSGSLTDRENDTRGERDSGLWSGDVHGSEFAVPPRPLEFETEELDLAHQSVTHCDGECCTTLCDGSIEKLHCLPLGSVQTPVD